jgi:predicted Zn-dependent peptidase
MDGMLQRESEEASLEATIEQEMANWPWESEMPQDPSISIGSLPQSGLTYYVKPNAVPTNRVHLRLVVKVGSVHEQAHERGFAHLIEHLLFRHTESFKDNEIQRFLSSLGARPGADSNATTYQDYTVFNLMIPVDERTIDYGFSYVDMGIKVLAEMAMRAQFIESIVEQERRIVLEELRVNPIRNSQASKAALYGTPYHAIPSHDSLDILKECRNDHLIDFYRRWYQLSNMAVIAVGGFQDAQILVNLIERHFSKVPAHILPPPFQHPSSKDPLHPTQDIRAIVAEQSKHLKSISPTLFTPKPTLKDSNMDATTPWHNIDSDSESAEALTLSQSSSPAGSRHRRLERHGDLKFFLTRNKDDSQSHMVLMFRHIENPMVGSLVELRTRFTINVLAWLLNNRANLLVNAYLGRMIDLVASESRLTSTIRVFEIGFSCTVGCELETLSKVIMEIERLKRFLIAEEDMEQLKVLSTELCQREESIKRGGVPSDTSADQIVKHFLHNEPLLSPSIHAHAMHRIIQSWTTEDIQMAATEVFDLNTAVLFVSLPEKDIPNQSQQSQDGAQHVSSPHQNGDSSKSSSRRHPPTKSLSHPDHSINKRESDEFGEAGSSGSRSPKEKRSESSYLDHAPERPDITEEDCLEVIEHVEKLELDPIYYYKTPHIMNVEDLPDPGRVVSVTNKGSSTIYTLENGARVQLNSVPAIGLRNSLGIDLELTAEGGLAEFWSTEGLHAFHSAMVSNAFAKYISLGGVPLGSSPFELGVILVDIQTFLFERRARFTALPTRLETLVQLIHCMFMKHPANWSEEFCRQEIDMMLEYSRTARSPETKMRERSIALCWQNNALLRPLSEYDLRRISIEDSKRWFETAWSNPEEFFFQFTGDFSSPEVQQKTIGLISRYIGSIPPREEPEYSSETRGARLLKANSKVAKTVRFRPGVKREVIYEAAEGTAHVLLSFPIPSFKTHLEVDVTEIVTLMLETYLFQILRSHLAKIYSVSVTSMHHFGSFFPGDATIQFVCDPHHVNQLIDRVFDAIDDLQQHGPSHRLLESSRTIYRKQKEASNLTQSNMEHDGQNSVFGSKVATRDIDLLLDNKLAKWLFNLLFPLDNYVQIVMLPESHRPPPQKTSVSPLLVTLGLVAITGAAVAIYNKLKPKQSS